MIEELRRFAQGEAYDKQSIPRLDSEALDFRAASESFPTVPQLARRDLATLQLMADHQSLNVPTPSGMVLLGKDRDRRPPDA